MMNNDEKVLQRQRRANLKKAKSQFPMIDSLEERHPGAKKNGKPAKNYRNKYLKGAQFRVDQMSTSAVALKWCPDDAFDCSRHR